MEYKKFGKTDLKVSALGLGAAPIGSRTDRKTSIQTLEEAFDAGINFYDTAPSYGQGSSEKILGEAFRKKRDQVIITTKVGHSITPVLQAVAQLKPLVRATLQSIPGIQKIVQRQVQTFVQSQTSTENFEPDYIVKSVEESLGRLRSDYIDLLLLHSPPSSVIEKGDAFDALNNLVSQGKIRYYGVSVGDLDSTVQCLNNQDLNLSALQATVNLYEQEAIQKLLPLAASKGIACIAREPFAHGKLIPKTVEKSGLGYLGPLESDDYFDFLAANSTRTITEAALQFLMQIEEISVVLAGMSQAKHIHQNVNALNAPKLTSDEMQRARMATPTLN
jgi:aryl-alcohol dehydrogenase-like predicted oxidoreductase